MGHHFQNWANEQFSVKARLKRYCLVCGLNVPASESTAPFLSRSPGNEIFVQKNRALILTGDDIEAHEWLEQLLPA